jgi:hypothetical protein
MRHGALAWIAFSFAVAAAWGFASQAWMLGWYMRGQIAFLALTILAATVVLRSTPLTWKTNLAIVAGIAVGNFGLLEVGAMIAIWSFGEGFAP